MIIRYECVDIIKWWSVFNLSFSRTATNKQPNVKHGFLLLHTNAHTRTHQPPPENKNVDEFACCIFRICTITNEPIVKPIKWVVSRFWWAVIWPVLFEFSVSESGREREQGTICWMSKLFSCPVMIYFCERFIYSFDSSRCIRIFVYILMCCGIVWCRSFEGVGRGYSRVCLNCGR